MDREPIFWSSTQPHSNDSDRMRDRMVNGKRVREKVPQIGHDGDYDRPKKAQNSRWATVVRHDGHTVFMVFTNAAAHLETSTTFAAYQKSKMRHFGWYALGDCPLALLATGALTKDHFVDQSILTQSPCERGTYGVDKPCPHCISERDARRKQHAADEAEKLASFRDASEKTVDAMQDQAAAMREQTKMLAEMAKATMSAAIAKPKAEPSK